MTANQGLSKVCIAVGAHLIPVIQGKSNRTLALPIYAAKMSSSSLWIDRRGHKITDFISCLFVVTNTNQVKLAIVLIGQRASLLISYTNKLYYCTWYSLINKRFDHPGGGGVRRGKKDRDDCRKS